MMHMCQSIYYYTYQILILEALTLDKDSFKLIFDEKDSSTKILPEVDEDWKFNLQSLIETIEHNEIWKIF